MIAGFLLLGSVAAALIGLVLLTPATVGVGALAIACYLAVLTRIVQASDVPPKKPKPVAPIWNTERKVVGPLEVQCKTCGNVVARGPSHCPQCGTKLHV